MAGYPPGSGYPYGAPPPNPYGAPPPNPYGASAPPYGGSEKPPKEGKVSGYGHPPAAGGYYGMPSPSPAPYGEKPPKEGKTSGYGQPPAGGGYYGMPSAPSAPYGEKPPKEGKHQEGGGGGYGYGSGQGYGQPPSGAGYYGAAPPAAAAPYGSPFAALVPSVFQPGTDPSIVACFQAADRDGSGFIDDKELQQALSSYNQAFSMRTVHLLMYLFNSSNVRKIGPREFTSLFYSLQNWRGIFERFDRDRSGKIDISELSEALYSLGFSVSPVILDLLVSKFDKTGGKARAVEYDNFIECCLTVKGLTEKFKEKDLSFSGSATFTYESFMLTVLPFLIA